MFGHSASVLLRNWLRDVPPVRWIYVKWMAQHGYEARFSEALLEQVGPDSTVWDIGANVGHYVRAFMGRGAGKVVCFEPAPGAVAELQRLFSADERIIIVPVALAETNGTACFPVDGASVTNSIDGNNVLVGQTLTINVPVRRADDIVGELGLPVPNVIKVDVEGFEYEVLRGMATLLANPALKALLVEVHFRRLHERGLDHAPAEIVSVLRKAGFTIRWIDLSHLAATRGSWPAGAAE